MSLNNVNAFNQSAHACASYSNQIDCAFEYITENLMGLENFVPESGNPHSHHDYHLHKTITYCWCMDQPSAPLQGEEYGMICMFGSLRCPIAEGYIRDINPPPPRV